MEEAGRGRGLPRTVRVDERVDETQDMVSVSLEDCDTLALATSIPLMELHGDRRPGGWNHTHPLHWKRNTLERNTTRKGTAWKRTTRKRATRTTRKHGRVWTCDNRRPEGSGRFGGWSC